MRATEEYLWMTVPKGVAFKHIKNPQYVAKMKKLIKEGRMVNPVFKRGDLRPMRFLAHGEDPFETIFLF